jgi:hypothetical protein
LIKERLKAIHYFICIVLNNRSSEKSKVKMFSTWDLVRPSYWHPMSSLEQSMMDLDMMANQMFSSRFPMTTTMIAAPSMTEDDDFFQDLPVAAREQQPAQSQPRAPTEGSRAFSTYSYSNSSVVDEKGKHIVSTRRRYEDSTGRLKAVHEREVNGCTLKTIWNRKSKDEEGEHRTLCSQGSAEEFEKMWAQTPFGKAQEKQLKENTEESPQQQQEQLQGQQQESQKGGQQQQQQQHQEKGQQHQPQEQTTTTP